METLDRPMTFTYNQFDTEEIAAVLTQIKAKQIQPHVPYEFTHEGMLQRIHALVNLCLIIKIQDTDRHFN